MTESLPAMPYESWRPTKETLHRFTQIVGKVALAEGIRRNHWWHITYRLTARGLRTVPLGAARRGPVFDCAFDFFDHVLRIADDRGTTVEIDMPNRSVADFYTDVRSGLAELGVDMAMPHPHPFDLPDAERPFARDIEHADYDPDQARAAFGVLSQVGRILEEFSATYSGKVSPVQFFWHTFDLAVQRFSDRHVEMPPTVDSVTREAYSREEISAGFWFGDPDVPAPTFYSYVAPEPDGLTERPLSGGGRWVTAGSGHSAYLDYDDARRADDPVGAALAFYQSVYAAGSQLCEWDTDRLACWGGVTDPILARTHPRWPEWPTRSASDPVELRSR
ncbi:DUF5996 family protein [Nocardia bovistercoris]|uniref:Ava_C0101 and related proteins n=1 Tax=Nocardia bovistercoris TaxID=2785916 RepID=A0A931ICH1_9NOCA|nr:DUF5996 family protein [Nocardia bovistercoris]MBH0778571.1 hypothetical protein [Nocardia bovistercoris]